MTGPHHLVAASFLFGLGAVVGSFLNVCVHRIPRGLSVLRPASRCPGCGLAVSPRDNVPILGWLLLRGRCRGCGGGISPRYPAVEAAVGLLTATPYLLVLLIGRDDPLESGPGPMAWRLADTLALSGFLVTGALIAMDTGSVPSRVASAGIVAAALLGATRPPAAGEAAWSGLVDALAGLLVGLASASLAARLGRRATGEGGLGAGDLAFAAMVGAFVGGRAIVPVLAVAAAVALVAPALVAARHRAAGDGTGPGRSPLPFVAALGLAGLLPMLIGFGPGPG